LFYLSYKYPLLVKFRKWCDVIPGLSSKNESPSKMLEFDLILSIKKKNLKYYVISEIIKFRVKRRTFYSIHRDNE
jgi:hypothetical protein